MRQLLKRLEGPARPELGVSASGDELMGLDEELDVADAAPSELDVVAGHRNSAVALMRMDPPLHGVDVGDRGEVEIFAPDERRELAQELLARGEISGNHARLDQRGALPILAEALIIA